MIAAHIQNILDRLPGVKKSGDGWVSLCPVHESDGKQHQASLSVDIGDNGSALLLCRAGCPTPDVLRAIGLTERDLFPARERKEPKANANIVATYDYIDANGVMVFQVVRYEDKRFLQRRPDPQHPGQWLWNLNGTPRILYNVPALVSAPREETVFIVEGEKDVDSLTAIGLPATCNSGGAMKWKVVSDDSVLHGKDIVIIVDKDDVGRRHGADVAAKLKGKVASIKIIEVPGDDNKDVSDWIGSLDCREPEQLRAALREMANAAPGWETPVDAMPVASAKDDEPDITPPTPYVPFPTSILPSPFDLFIVECAAAMCCDPAFIALPLLVVMASAIGNTRRLRLKDTWFEIYILWGAIVGYSGTMKSPAMDKALDFMNEYQKVAFKQYELAMKTYRDELLQFEAALTAWKRRGGKGFPPAEPEKPKAERYFCSDITLEALAVLLRDNLRGVLLHRDELSAWFGSFDRYAQTRGGDCGQWLSVFGGRPLTVDRKKDGTLYVPRASVSVLGSIQPNILARVLGRQFYENGLAARLLLVMPPPRPKVWSEDVVNPAIVEAVDAVFKNLYAMEPARGPEGDPEPLSLTMDAKAKAVWTQFYNDHNEEQVELTGDLASMWSKIECYAARFILLIHCARCAAGDPTVSPNVVDVDSAVRGVELARWFGAEAKRVYSVLKESDGERQQTDLIKVVRQHGGSITPRELMRCGAYATAEAARNTLNVLVENGQGQWVQESPEHGGRPSQRFVLMQA
jgi:5S rRNA maturation endonuclease (ribonuclease M5)